MKISKIAGLGLATIMMTTISCDKQKRQDKLNTEIDSVSYALGLDMSNKLKLNFAEANDAAFVQGYKDASDSLNTAIKSTDIDDILRTFFMKKQQEAMLPDSLVVSDAEKIKSSGNAKNLINSVDSVSYALGLDMANKMKPNFSEVNGDLFVQGYSEAQDSTKVLLEEGSIDFILRTYFIRRQKEIAEKRANEQFGDVKEQGVKFLEENESADGVVTTESGLQYVVLTEGGENHPTATDNVTVHYHGTTIDGTVFDSSVDRGTPASFGLNQVIKGWTEGLQLMGEGAKFKFFIPQELAYGANAPGGGQGVIKPFMPLVFEVELISINK